MTADPGPFPVYSLIYGRQDGLAIARRAAFPSDAEAREHARRGLLRRDAAWITAMVARSEDLEADLLGVWDREAAGGLVWSDARRP